MNLNLSAPKNTTWWIAIVLGVLGLLGSLMTIPVISGLSLWLLFLGFALLAVATMVDGL
jgi:hypothetical protein